MNRTETPPLDVDALHGLWDYTNLFVPDFRFRRQAEWAAVYVRALLQDGERKSVEPLAARVPLPPGLRVRDPLQALQNFVNQSPWEEEKVWKHYRAIMAKTFSTPHAIFVVDDTSFPKDGKHSVGVQRQYCGALGKKDNCQVAVSLHYVGTHGHFPLAMRLYLPESWVGDPARLDMAGVPPGYRRDRTKGEIALDLLDLVRNEGLPGQIVVTDAGYGVAQEFRDRLAARGLYFVAGVTEDLVVFEVEPSWVMPATPGRGRPRSRPRLVEDHPRPVAVQELARRLPRQPLSWREGTKGALSAKFSWTRVWPGHGWATGDCAEARPVWLLIEEQADGQLKYAFSNLPAESPMSEGVAYWKSRWPVEQGYQQMKSELGLDHFEGRSWRGFHHHVCLVMVTFGFLALERRRATAEGPPVKDDETAEGDVEKKNGRPARDQRARDSAGDAAVDRASLSAGMSELSELHSIPGGAGRGCTYCTSALTEYY
jgi:SRSO17 transposase